MLGLNRDNHVVYNVIVELKVMKIGKSVLSLGLVGRIRFEFECTGTGRRFCA